MTALQPTRHVPYPLRVQTPSGDVHKYTPGGVINVSDKQDVEWLLKTGDWERSVTVVNEVAEVVPTSTAVAIPLNTVLDDMTKDELIEFAQTNGIDVNPRDKKDDIRLMIDLFLDELEA